MYTLKSVSVAAMGVLAWATLSTTDASAQMRGRGRMGGGAMGSAAMRAGPRVGRPMVRSDFSRFNPRVTNLPYRRSFDRSFRGSFYRPFYGARFNRPFYAAGFNRPFYGAAFNRPFYRSYAYRPFYGAYRPGVSFGIASGFGYPYYRYRYSYPYRSSYYVYPDNYPYNYTYFNDNSTTSSHDYTTDTSSDVTAVPSVDYGGVRLKDAPDDSLVVVDGNYVGRAGDFDGAHQAMILTPGSHRVVIQASRMAPLSFNVHVIPGQTITIRTGLK